LNSKLTILQQKIDFIIEVDKLKNVLRQSVITQSQRRENSAEHSWHLAILLITLQDYSPKPIDLLKCLKIALIHDIVEIDSGDVYAFDTDGRLEKQAHEERAAKRLFAMLPQELGSELHKLWLEYEEQKTTEARFVKIMDRIQPLLLNYLSQGHTWKKHSVSYQRVLEINQAWAKDAPELFEYIKKLLEECRENEYFI